MDSSDRLRAKTDELSALIRGLDTEHCPEPLDYVQALRLIESTAVGALADAVEKARAAGHSWAQVGNYLGVSAQAAHERYAKTIFRRATLAGRPVTIPADVTTAKEVRSFLLRLADQRASSAKTVRERSTIVDWRARIEVSADEDMQALIPD